MRFNKTLFAAIAAFTVTLSLYGEYSLRVTRGIKGALLNTRNLITDVELVGQPDAVAGGVDTNTMDGASMAHVTYGTKSVEIKSSNPNYDPSKLDGVFAVNLSNTQTNNLYDLDFYMFQPSWSFIERDGVVSSEDQYRKSDYIVPIYTAAEIDRKLFKFCPRFDDETFEELTESDLAVSNLSEAVRKFNKIVDALNSLKFSQDDSLKDVSWYDEYIVDEYWKFDEIIRKMPHMRIGLSERVKNYLKINNTKFYYSQSITEYLDEKNIYGDVAFNPFKAYTLTPSIEWDPSNDDWWSEYKGSSIIVSELPDETNQLYQVYKSLYQDLVEDLDDPEYWDTPTATLLKQQAVPMLSNSLVNASSRAGQTVVVFGNDISLYGYWDIGLGEYDDNFTEDLPMAYPTQSYAGMTLCSTYLPDNYESLDVVTGLPIKRWTDVTNIYDYMEPLISVEMDIIIRTWYGMNDMVEDGIVTRAQAEEIINAPTRTEALNMYLDYGLFRFARFDPYIVISTNPVDVATYSPRVPLADWVKPYYATDDDLPDNVVMVTNLTDGTKWERWFNPNVGWRYSGEDKFSLICKDADGNKFDTGYKGTLFVNYYKNIAIVVTPKTTEMNFSAVVPLAAGSAMPKLAATTLRPLSTNEVGTITRKMNRHRSQVKKLPNGKRMIPRWKLNKYQKNYKKLKKQKPANHLMPTNTLNKINFKRSLRPSK